MGKEVCLLLDLLVVALDVLRDRLPLLALGLVLLACQLQLRLLGGCQVGCLLGCRLGSRQPLAELGLLSPAPPRDAASAPARKGHPHRPPLLSPASPTCKQRGVVRWRPKLPPGGGQKG